MVAIKSPFSEEMTLGLIASKLAGFSPPESPFDPEGEWTLSYGVYSLANVCDLAGGLTLFRKPSPDGGASITLDYEKHLPDSRKQNVTAKIHCSADRLSTPDRWSYRSEVLDQAGELLEQLSLERSALAKDDLVEFRTGGRLRNKRIARPFTLGWLLFDAVQRLPRREFSPIRFAMFDDFDQVKASQELSFHKTVDVDFGDSGTVRLYAFDHLGEGIVPWVYWVDGEGRLLFAVAGIEAYILQL